MVTLNIPKSGEMLNWCGISPVQLYLGLYCITRNPLHSILPTLVHMVVNLLANTAYNTSLHLNKNALRFLFRLLQPISLSKRSQIRDRFVFVRWVPPLAEKQMKTNRIAKWLKDINGWLNPPGCESSIVSHPVHDSKGGRG